MKISKKVESCIFDEVYRDVVAPFFTTITDGRAFNARFSLSDALKSGFAIYSLKAPSLFAFQTMSQSEEYNLSSIFQIGDIPSDNGLRKMLDEVSPDELRQCFNRLFDYTHQCKVFNRYHYWRDYLLVSIDGVQHFQSKKVSCPHCLKRRHRDGSVSNYHSLLSAAIVSPEYSEVFPIDHEPVIIQDGNEKNDCERNAAHRLIGNLQKSHSHRNMVLTMDALYSCAPIVKLINSQRTGASSLVLPKRDIGIYSISLIA